MDERTSDLHTALYSVLTAIEDGKIEEAEVIDAVETDGIKRELTILVRKTVQPVFPPIDQ